MKQWRETVHVFQTFRVMQDESDIDETYSALINPLTTNVLHHIETSQLICIVKVFYEHWSLMG